MERWEERLELFGESYTVEFSRRPFREGLEVSVRVGKEILKVAEFGLGREALLEKIADLIANHLKRHSKNAQNTP